MGLLRVVLALSVIAGHADTTILGLTGVDSFYAVEAFFIISGFYMALVLNGKYAQFPVSSFYKSRALRIYPGYFAAIVLMVALNGTELASAIHRLKPSWRVFVYVQDAVIFGQDLSYLFCLREKAGGCSGPWSVFADPPAWSLSVELLFYLAAPFVVRQPRRLLVLVAVGTVYLLLTNALYLPIESRLFVASWEAPLRYYFYPASFLFFGAGALAFHLHRLDGLSSYLLLIVAVFAFGFVPTVMPAWHAMVFALAIPALFRITQSNRYDRAIGEFSYPLYILHWPYLVFVKGHRDLFAPLMAHASLGTIVAALAALTAIAVYLGIDRPIDRIRRPSPATPHDATRELPWAKALLAAYLIVPFAMLAAVVA